MRHFGHIPSATRTGLFHREPAAFTADSPARTLAVALGATLYSPATRPRLADDVRKQAARGVVSMVLCLEDSISDADVEAGEDNLVRQFADLAAGTVTAADTATGTAMDVPLLFIRVRDPRQITDLVDRLGETVRLLSGFVLPKFTETRGHAFLEALAQAERTSGRMALRHARSGVPRAPPPGDPGRDPRPTSPRSPTSTATASSPCASASPTSAPPTGSAARPT